MKGEWLEGAELEAVCWWEEGSLVDDSTVCDWKRGKQRRHRRCERRGRRTKYESSSSKT